MRLKGVPFHNFNTKKLFNFKGCFNYFSVSARHFNHSARSENQISKFMNTNGVLTCDEKG